MLKLRGIAAIIGYIWGCLDNFGILEAVGRFIGYVIIAFISALALAALLSFFGAEFEIWHTLFWIIFIIIMINRWRAR